MAVAALRLSHKNTQNSFFLNKLKHLNKKKGKKLSPDKNQKKRNKKL